SHLVDRVFDWPGVNSLRWMDGRPLKIKRPKIFFRERGSMPAEVTLTITPPKAWPGDRKSWVKHIRAAVEAKETRLRQWRLANNRRVVGRRNVLRASESSRPATPEQRIR